MKKILGITVCILLLCVGFSGCINQAEEDSEKQSEILRIGISEEPYGFFPWITSYDVGTLGINFNIFNPLVEFDSSFKLFPKLAKSWNNPEFPGREPAISGTLAIILKIDQCKHTRS